MESGEMDLLSKQAILSLPRDVEKSLDGKILDEYINVKDIEALPTIQSVATDTNVGDTFGQQTVKHLDNFTKTFCRDNSVKDDLVFRCSHCDFQVQNGRCLVKRMARKLCPDYKDFGSMGDL